MSVALDENAVSTRLDKCSTSQTVLSSVTPPDGPMPPPALGAKWQHSEIPFNRRLESIPAATDLHLHSVKEEPVYSASLAHLTNESYVSVESEKALSATAVESATQIGVDKLEEISHQQLPIDTSVMASPLTEGRSSVDSTEIASSSVWQQNVHATKLPLKPLVCQEGNSEPRKGEITSNANSVEKSMKVRRLEAPASKFVKSYADDRKDTLKLVLQATSALRDIYDVCTNGYICTAPNSLTDLQFRFHWSEILKCSTLEELKEYLVIFEPAYQQYSTLLAVDATTLLNIIADLEILMTERLNAYAFANKETLRNIDYEAIHSVSKGFSAYMDSIHKSGGSLLSRCCNINEKLECHKKESISIAGSPRKVHNMSLRWGVKRQKGGGGVPVIAPNEDVSSGSSEETDKSAYQEYTYSKVSLNEQCQNNHLQSPLSPVGGRRAEDSTDGCSVQLPPSPGASIYERVKNRSEGKWRDGQLDESWAYAYPLIHKIRSLAMKNINIRWARERTAVGGSWVVGKGRGYCWRCSPKDPTPESVRDTFHKALIERNKSFGPLKDADNSCVDAFAVVTAPLGEALELNEDGLKKAADSMLDIHRDKISKDPSVRVEWDFYACAFVLHFRKNGEEHEKLFKAMYADALGVLEALDILKEWVENEKV